MRRRWTVVGATVAVALALTGCVGIPTSGGVQAGDLIDEESDSGFEFGVSGPQAGSSMEEILDGFMAAARGPQDGFIVARQFLTEDFAADWDPDAGVIIRSDGGVAEPGSLSDTLVYTVTSGAFVDAEGRYFERPQATQTLDFAFTEENGEWRISAAPPGIVLAANSFELVFSEEVLYFFDPSFGYLVPDVRWFPSRPTTPLRVVQALLLGPASWLRDGVVSSAFPTGTALGRPDTGSGVAIESGTTATVDLSSEALSASPVDRDRMRQQLAATLGVPNIAMTVAGIELDTPEPSGGAIVRPIVDSAALIGAADAFGLEADGGITPIGGGLGDKVVGLGATAATLSNDKSAAAVLGADGGAYLVTTGDAPAVPLDPGPGLTTPTIDPFQFVWSAHAASAASLTAFASDGTVHPVQSGLPADASIVSMDLSRDGARLLLYLSTPGGPRLVIAGVIRDTDNLPLRLGQIEDLPVPEGSPIDATWVDERSVATLSGVGAVTRVTGFEIGGPRADLGQVQHGTAIAGGSGSEDGLRVLNAGEVWRPQGGGWVSTGVSASFLGTKQ